MHHRIVRWTAISRDIMNETNRRKWCAEKWYTEPCCQKGIFRKGIKKLETNQDPESNQKVQIEIRKKLLSTNRCRKIGHKAANCEENMKKSDSANKADDISLYATALNFIKENPNLQGAKNRERWYLDSRCTIHSCKSTTKFIETDRNVGKLNFTSNVSMEIKARGVYESTHKFKVRRRI